MFLSGRASHKLAGTVGKTIQDCLVGGVRDGLLVFHPPKPDDFDT